MYLALVLVSFLVDFSSSNTVSEPERHQVVIVGAGVSGISAAATLLENNVNDIIILESADRIGGRIHTVEFGGITIEKGAEFVHGEKNNAVFELVQTYDLLVSNDKTFLHTDQLLFTNPKGEVLNSTYVLNLLEQAYNTLEDVKFTDPNVSVADYFNSKVDELLRTNNVDSKLGEAIRHHSHGRICLYEGSDNITQLGSSLGESVDAEGDLSLKWKQGTGGYRILFDILTKKYPNPENELPVLNKIKLEKHVTQIKFGDNNPVEISCEDGSKYLADHVIVTVSLGVLKKHADTMFQPALPERKTAAIKLMGFGSIAKVFILFPTRWWSKDINTVVSMLSKEDIQDLKSNTVHGHWTADLVGFFPVMGSDRMLIGWLFGESTRTMESLTEEQVTDGMVEYLNKTLGKTFTNISRPESILRSSWVTNPNTLGTYSFHAVEFDKQNLTNGDLAAPVLDTNNKPVLLFAGEATNPRFYSTVHGALETGRREAHNLINYLQNHTGS